MSRLSAKQKHNQWFKAALVYLIIACTFAASAQEVEVLQIGVGCYMAQDPSPMPGTELDCLLYEPHGMRLFGAYFTADQFFTIDSSNCINFESSGFAISQVVESTNQPGSGFIVEATYGQLYTWDEWVDLPGSQGFFQGCGEIEEHHTTWYYSILTAGTITGYGEHEGEFLQLAHQPTNAYFGMQIGQGASGRNGEFGYVSWFLYEGEVDGDAVMGSGDFFGTLEYFEVLISGCTQPGACNYNPEAIIDDGTCLPLNEVTGECDCTDLDLDGVCDEFEMQGCTYPNACNFDSGATEDDGSCIFICPGCTDAEACNYDASALQENGTCIYSVDLCGQDHLDCNCECISDTDSDGICDEAEVVGCLNPGACNYNPLATDSGPCEVESCAGCIYEFACNFDPEAVISDGSCEFGTCAGCTNLQACNYNPTVTEDDGSCQFPEACLDCEGTCDESNETCNCDTSCTIPEACNFLAPFQDCTFPLPFEDCDGNCLNDADGDGICDELEVTGCTNPAACNFNPAATDDDGSCLLDVEAQEVVFNQGFELGFQSALDQIPPASLCGSGTTWAPEIQQCIGETCPADINLDGYRGTADLLLLLSSFDTFCP